MAPEYLTTPEVANRFRASPETVRYWRQVGRGPKWARVGRRVLYRTKDVQAWADEQWSQNRSAANSPRPAAS